MESAKGLIITAVVTLLVLVGGVILLSKGGSSPKKPVIVDANILIGSGSYQTNKGAKITIVEFGDYRCPACKQAFPIMQQVLKDYGNKVNFIFRNFAFLPDSTTNATPNASTLAANAALCAGDQGKFWEMHDFFYQNQPPETDISMYNLDTLTKDASTLGVDQNKFKACLTSKADDSKVKADLADGQLAGVTGTPSFFVNGQMLPGVPMYNDFKSLIDSLLK